MMTKPGQTIQLYIYAGWKMENHDMNILFLDDDINRHVVFDTLCLKAIRNNTYHKAYDSKTCMEILASGVQWDVVFLDHDLSVDDRMCIPGVNNKVATGTDVAQFIVENKIPIKLVIIHSFNAPGSRRMADIFDDAGYKNAYVPFSDTLRLFL
jgi:hypothetical protein